MLRLIFKKGTQDQKINKCETISNLRASIKNAIRKDKSFPKEVFDDLKEFPKSQIKTYLFVRDGLIKSYVETQDAANIKFENAGYAIPSFYESENIKEKEWIVYCVSNYELKKIGWKPNQVPLYLIEVFKKLDCMPDLII